MSQTLSYKISDEIREDIAWKLKLSAVVPMEIPCTYYQSSGAVKLYLDLAGTKPPHTDSKSDLSFLDWYDTNYPAANYTNDADRLGHFIMDLIQRGAYFYTIEGDRQTGTSGELVSLSDKVKINGIRTFNNYRVNKEQSTNTGNGPDTWKYSLYDQTNSKQILNIVSNDDIVDGTEFISFYLDMSNHPASAYEPPYSYVTICK